MRSLLLLGLGLCAAGALLRTQEQGARETHLSPLLAALALEVGIFLLRHQGGLLNATMPVWAS